MKSLSYEINLEILANLELNPLFGYHKVMLNRFAYFAIYLLLVIMPLQALASANMLVCNSATMDNGPQLNLTNQSITEMPCHQQVVNIQDNNKTSETKSSTNQTPSCKTLCANFCGHLAAFSAVVTSNFSKNLAPIFDFNHQIYTSIHTQNLQRPPISSI